MIALEKSPDDFVVFPNVVINYILVICCNFVLKPKKRGAKHDSMPNVERF